MDSKFWKEAWEEGRTGFHQRKFNDKLLQYFPTLAPQAGQKILVPLCGKSRDMAWLHDQGLEVRGIELYEEAVIAFFPENGLPGPVVTSDSVYRNYTSEKITISCGDFFRFKTSAQFDFVYDRAALVALPPEMRADYVRVIHGALKPGGKILLLTYEYAPEELQGPPFSISEEEIARLYRKEFSIEKKESSRPEFENNRMDAVPSLRQNVYVLKKL